MRFNQVPLWFSALLVLGGCPGPDPEENPQLSAVTVTCVPVTVMVGQSSQCTAKATDQKGESFTVSGYTWTSSNQSVATVDATGKVTTTTAGTVDLRASATADGVTQQGQATLTVTQAPPQLSVVTVTCAPTSVVVGQSSQCTASAADQYGQPFTVSGYTWTSSNELVAKVDATGKATTFTGGTANLRASATVGGVTQQGQATLMVTDPPSTVHTGNITTSETWRAADNPHVVRGLIEVTGASAPTLTLEAGVELRFEQDAELRVTSGGALRALGTQAAPLRLVAKHLAPTKGHWRGVVLATGGNSSELNYVTLSHCGRTSGEGACLTLKNQATPVLRQVTVQDSGTAGVLVADDGSAFGAGSTKLSVTRSESYAVRIGANQTDTVPADGSFTDNAINAIELRGSVRRSQTWLNPSVPYVVNSNIQLDPTSPSTLTISAGTVLRFGRDYRLVVGGTSPGSGLIVNGTESKPVLFTADSASPQPGHWRGVFLGPLTSSDTRISYATIEYGGGGTSSSGNLILSRDSRGTPRPVLDNVVVRKSSTYGFLLQGGTFGPGSAMLTARDNGGYPIGVEANDVGTLPTNITFIDNGRNAVEVLYGDVVTTQTWPNLGVPYVINTFMNVGAAPTEATPTLTLLPGTELRFNPDAGMSIGGTAGGNELLPGVLKVEASPEAPVRFVSNTLPPAKGSWRGLHFWEARGSLFYQVFVTHAGAPGFDGSIGTGNVNVYREIGFFMINTTLSNSSHCGLTVSDGSHPNTEPVTTNHGQDITFVDNNDGDVCTN